VALAAVTQATDFLERRQAVTAVIAPSAAAPSGCAAKYTSPEGFGIAAIPLSPNAAVKPREGYIGTRNSEIKTLTESASPTTLTTSVATITTTDKTPKAPLSTITIAPVNAGRSDYPHTTPPLNVRKTINLHVRQSSEDNDTVPSNSIAPPLVGCDSPGALSLQLIDGVLKDRQGRIGYIASNYQFQVEHSL